MGEEQILWLEANLEGLTAWADHEKKSAKSLFCFLGRGQLPIKCEGLITRLPNGSLPRPTLYPNNLDGWKTTRSLMMK